MQDTAKLSAQQATLRASDFKQRVGPFLASSFVPGVNQALTSTQDGDVVVWEAGPRLDSCWSAIKVLRLHHGPIRVLTTCGSHVVTGGDDGLVRFYDKR